MDHLPTAAEIDAVNHGHSVFAPSSSAMHSTCAASLLLNFGKADHGSIDAAYGTVGHQLGEEWLKILLEHRATFYVDEDLDDDVLDNYAPVERIGERVHVQKGGGSKEFYTVTIDEEMISHVRRYVAWCINLPGDHYVETRVDISELTPIPGQGGTADHAVIHPQTVQRRHGETEIVNRLVITDLKMGRGEAIYPAEFPDDPRAIIDGRPNGNTQAMDYAFGFLRLYGDMFFPDDEVVIRIAQPPRDYFGEWHTTVAEIIENFAPWIKKRYRENWKLDQPRTASIKGCRWCKVKATCSTWIVLFDTLSDDVFSPVGDFIEGEFREVTGSEIVSAGHSVADKVLGKKAMPQPGDLTTDQLEMVKLWRKPFEHYFVDVDAELLLRARDGHELKHFKLVPGRKSRREPKEDMAEIAVDLIGLTDDEIHNRVLMTPVELTALVRRKYKVTKKVAEAIVATMVTRQDGQDTLAPLKDVREAIEDVGSVFDNIEDEL